MATVFGRRLRGRKSGAAADEEVTPIADQAHLWWTRRDFVQHAVVWTRGRSSDPANPGDGAGAPRAGARPWGPPPGHHGHADDPLAGRSFAEAFPTESLFAEPAPDRSAGAAAPPHAEPRATPTQAAYAPPSPRRRPIAANHPLMSSLEHLGVGRDATWSEIQLAYRSMAKQAHPDITSDDGAAMAALNAAYGELREGRNYGLFDEE